MSDIAETIKEALSAQKFENRQEFLDELNRATDSLIEDVTEVSRWVANLEDDEIEEEMEVNIASK